MLFCVDEGWAESYEGDLNESQAAQALAGRKLLQVTVLHQLQ